MPTARTQTLLPLALAILPGPALAELTAQGLWQDWQSAAAERGLSIAAETVSETGDGLRLTGVTSRLAENDDTNVTATAPLVTLTERGDGQVDLAFPEGKRITIEETGDQPGRAVLALDSSALTVTASGTPGATDYTWLAPALSLELTEFDPGEEPVEADLSLTAQDLSGRLRGYGGPLDRPVTALVEASETTWSLALSEPGSNDAISAEARQSDVVLQAETISQPPPDAPVSTARTELAFDAGSGSSSSRQTLAGMTQSSESRHDTISLHAILRPDVAFYTAAGTGIALSLDGPQFPIRPLDMTVAEADMAYFGPTAPDDAPQPFDLTVELIDLTPTEALWAQLDPAGALPRDPLRLELDLSGQALNGPAARMPTLPQGGDRDFAPTEVTINRMDLAYGSASAAAEGAFDLPAPSADGAALSPAAPVGALDITLTGVMELLAQLAQSGLMPQQQLLGAQMMLGMFATPQADGSLTSRIETRADGSLFVNGNQLR